MATSLSDVKPGSKINIKIVHRPTNIAASKTLERVLCKDPEHASEVQRHRKIRGKQTPSKQRGGREWVQRMVKQHPVVGTIGESGTVVASLDVLKDLKRVQRFIEIEAA